MDREDDETCTQTQNSTQTQSNNNIEELSRNIASVIMSKCGNRNTCKRTDIAKILGITQRTLNTAIKETAKLLDEVYGFKLIELPKQQYALILKDDSPDLDRPKDELHVILIAALTHIFMSGGSVSEDSMWQFLDEAGLVRTDDLTLKKTVMSRFTKEMYLEHTQVGDKENEKFIFSWGARANEEISKDYLLTKVAQSFNRPVDYWTEQHRNAFPSQEQDR